MYHHPENEIVSLLNTTTSTSIYNQPTTRENAAAALLVIGRLALAEYAVKRGQDPALISQMHDEAVAAWVDLRGCDRASVEQAVSNIHTSLCDGADVDSHIALVVPTARPGKWGGH